MVGAHAEPDLPISCGLLSREEQASLRRVNCDLGQVARGREDDPGVCVYVYIPLLHPLVYPAMLYTLLLHLLAPPPQLLHALLQVLVLLGQVLYLYPVRFEMHTDTHTHTTTSALKLTQRPHKPLHRQDRQLHQDISARRRTAEVLPVVPQGPQTPSRMGRRTDFLCTRPQCVTTGGEQHPRQTELERVDRWQHAGRQGRL